MSAESDILKKLSKRAEHQIQAACIDYINKIMYMPRYEFLQSLHSIPNGTWVMGSEKDKDTTDYGDNAPHWLKSIPGGSMPGKKTKNKEDNRKFSIIKKMIDEGLRPGVHDLKLPMFSFDKKYCGLYMECKQPGKKMNPNQIKFKKIFEACGNKVVQFTTLEEFIKEIEEYLNIKLPNQ